MPTRYPTRFLQNPERARVNWERLERTAPPEVLAALRAFLRGTPDPDTALNYFERFNDHASAGALQYLARNPPALNVLIPIFSQSHYLSETLLLHPEYVEWLHRDKRVEFVKSKEDLLQELSRFEATLGDLPLAERLVRFKRREYLRIALRDVKKIATLAETTWELSTLADVILEKAWRGCHQQLVNRFGIPRYVDGSGRIVSSEFVVLALGKLGGNELNYSSDIDLMYLYSHDGETEGSAERSEATVSNQEYFIKLSSAINETVSCMTPSGWAFRVDLRLRPQGREGFLSRSLKSTIEYYQHQAEPWELQALLKARPVAGSLALGKQLLRSLQCRIYPSEEKEKIVESIERMRTKIGAKLDFSGSSEFNVKLSRGTIRDVEFVTQCLQRLHGARDPWVREGNTVLALRRLQDNNYLARQEFVALASAYEFFRIIEHRLQLDRGEQTHSLPGRPEDQQLLALRMGFEDARDTTAREALLHAVEYHRGMVMRIYEQIMGKQRPAVPVAANSFFWPPGDAVQAAGGSDFLEVILNALQKINPVWAAAVRSLDIDPVLRPHLISLLETLISQPSRLEGFKFDSTVQGRLEGLLSAGAGVCGRIVHHPEWLLTYLSGRNLLSEQIHHPTPRRSVRTKPITQRRQKKRGSTPVAGTGKPGDQSMREGVRQQTLEVLLQDLSKQPPVSKTLRNLTSIAERAIAAALAMARAEVRKRLSPSERRLFDSPHFYFGVFALGRLAINELDLGSDLDLLFVNDASHFREREAVRQISFRLAEKVLSILTSYTREGPLYSVDLRLRPSGKEGELVQEAGYLLEYFRSGAQTWEHAAYLKLRPVGGDTEWAKKIQRRLRKTIFHAVKTEMLRVDLLDIRSRLEQSSAKDSSTNSFDLKQSAGGLYDIEFALAYAHLKHSTPYPTGYPLSQAVSSARRRRILSGSSVGLFEAAASFYRAIDHAVRLWAGKPVRAIDQAFLSTLPSCRLLQLKSGYPSLWTRASDQDEGIAAQAMKVCERTARAVREGMEETFQ